MKKYISINIFENEKYRINKVKDGFNDKFEIIEENDKLKIKRVDADEGWGANLKMKIFDKVNNKEYIKEIGNSNKNKVKVDLEKNISKNHYENNFYKLYAVSEHNDLFKINYNEISKELSVKRTDENIGWEQDLKIEYYEKMTKNIKYLHVGSSKNNKKKIIIDINKIDYIRIPDYYEDKVYKIKKIKNEYNDKFDFTIDHRTNILKVKRLDTDEGWGQPLMVNIEYKNKSYDIYIGSSEINILLKKVNLKDYNVYVCLTTIPSRASNEILVQNINNFIKTQTYDFTNLLITIPKKYKRFKENINDKVKKKLKSINKVKIIESDKDYGPASKYLGPLMNNYIKDNDLLIVIDDARIYNKNLVKHLVTAYRSFNQYEYFSGLWSHFFDKSYKYLSNDYLEITIHQEKNEDNFKFGNGLGGFFGFAMNIKNKKEFINYNLKILEIINKSFFHDEGILLGYLKKKEKNIIYLRHVGCDEYEKETVDALCKSGLCNRELIEKEILYVTNYQLIL